MLKDWLDLTEMDATNEGGIRMDEAALKSTVPAAATATLENAAIVAVIFEEYTLLKDWLDFVDAFAVNEGGIRTDEAVEKSTVPPLDTARLLKVPLLPDISYLATYNVGATRGPPLPTVMRELETAAMFRLEKDALDAVMLDV